ncbi:hypothetical protein E2P81_ATG01814 [Venturia nashicola]|uniref:Uncharacterized protein n=1 Tax=Venturia nashicola TaxID=86259 RepID=A0A4Z1P206_9PEZI|nr:hypothetical protein E6O75_ATG01861 [Venturia nashicola]TLD35511.1 hypothetical protein E2P81_ATG01814 [Venturia nashicola]
MTLNLDRPRYRATVAITIYLQIILWASLVGIIVSSVALGIAIVDIVLRPASILLLVSSFLSILYLMFHTLAARRRRSSKYEENANMLVKRPAYILTRMTICLAMSWLVTTGWNLIVAARQPVCFPGGVLAAYWQAGGACIAQRFGTAIAMILLIASSALFVTLEMSHDPLKSNLFGITRDHYPKLDPIEYRTASIHQSPFPRQGHAIENWEKSVAHSRNHSISSATARGPMREVSDASKTKPVLPLLTGTTVGNGLGATMSPRTLGEFPVSRPGTSLSSPGRVSTAPELRNLPPRGSRQVIRETRSTPSLSLRSPPHARVVRTSQSTSSLSSAYGSHHPYIRGHHSRSVSGSSLNLPGFNPFLSSSLLRAPPAPPVSMTDSAWRAVHPPSSQSHQRAPHGIFSNNKAMDSVSAPALNVPVTMANSRYAAREQGFGHNNASRAQSITGYGYHSRSHSSATNVNHPRSNSLRTSTSNFSNPVGAWVSTQQRLLPSKSAPSLPMESNGVRELEAISGPPPMRPEEMDLARRLERKLMEVQRKLDAQSAEVESESGGSGSSYSLGEIERGLSMSPVVERRVEGAG